MARVVKPMAFSTSGNTHRATSRTTSPFPYVNSASLSLYPSFAGMIGLLSSTYENNCLCPPS